MRLLLLLVAVFAFLTTLQAAEEVPEARYIDENALRAVWDLTRQTKSANPTAALSPQHPYLSHKERVTLQGERQTHYPVQPLNVAYALLPQSPLSQSRPITQTKDTLVDVQPIYLPYPLQNHATFPAQAFYQALAGFPAYGESSQPESQVKPQSKDKPSYVTNNPSSGTQTVQTKPPAYFAAYPTVAQKPPTQSHNIASEQKQSIFHATPNLLAFAHQTPTPFAYQPTRPDLPVPNYATTNSPAFIIINPTNYPSYNYYTASNYTLPRAVAVVDESQQPIEAEDEIPQNTAAQLSHDGAPLGVEPILTALPNSLTNDKEVWAHALLAQSQSPENQNLLLELLKREQLKRHMQERVAAFYFRNYNANKK